VFLQQAQQAFKKPNRESYKIWERSENLPLFFPVSMASYDQFSQETLGSVPVHHTANMIHSVVSFFLNPFMGFILQIIFSLASFMVSKKHVPWVFGVSVINGYICVRSIAATNIDREWFGSYLGDGPIDVIVKTSLLMALSIGALLFLENHVQRHRETFLGRLHEAYKQLTNGRRIGTDRMAPQMPVTEEYLAKSAVEKEKLGLEQSKLANAPDETPAELRGQKVGKSFHDRLGHIKREGRTGFIIRRLSLAVLLYVLEYIVKPVVMESIITMNNSDYSIEKVSFIRRINEVSLQEVKVRAYLVFETIWSAYAFYSMAHYFGSAVCEYNPPDPPRGPA
jgi:hypothetical protein